MIRSRMTSAIVGSPTMSYQLDDGYCEVMMTDFRSCLSSIISSSMGRFLGIKRYKEQVIKNEQLTTFDLFGFCFKCTFDLDD